MLFTMMFALGAATSGGISAIDFSDRQWQWLDLPLPPSGTLVPKMVANPSMKAETADTSGLWLPRVSGASVASTWYPSRTHARSINANQRLSNSLHVAKCCKHVKNLILESNQISGARITYVPLYVRFVSINGFAMLPTSSVYSIVVSFFYPRLKGHPPFFSHMLHSINPKWSHYLQVTNGTS